MIRKLKYLALLFLPLLSYGQQAAIMNTNMQIYASLHGKPVAWATTIVEIHLDKNTGAFEVLLLTDHLSLAMTNPDFVPTGENLGKVLSLRGTIPIYDVLNNNSNVMNMNIDLIANFNNIDFPTNFTFSILRLNPNDRKGFSLMVKGSLSISKLNITNLEGFDDELGISLSFTGI